MAILSRGLGDLFRRSDIARGYLPALAMTAFGASIAAYGLFMACVAVSTYAQNLTGFAFSLILLGLVAMLHVVPIPDAANAAMLLTLVNAWSYFRLHRVRPPWRLMRPVLWSSSIGVALGVALLGLLGSTSLYWLRGLLGICIVACAAMLLLQAKPRSTMSHPRSFVMVGVLSGILGGLFSSSGPPLVYHLYRQPLDALMVRNCLLLAFAANAAARLVLIGASGQFSARAGLLSVCAMPVVYGVTRLNHRFPSKASPAMLRYAVAALLLLAGGILVVTALNALLT